MTAKSGQLRKRGVSTLLATALLTVLVVAAGTLIYPYSIGYISAGLKEPIIPSMQIQSVAEESGALCLYVKNTGSTTLKLHDTLTRADLYVNGLTQMYSIDEPYSGGDLGEGVTCKIIISPVDADWVGKTNELKLIADDGTFIVTAYKVSTSGASNPP